MFLSSLIPLFVFLCATNAHPFPPQPLGLPTTSPRGYLATIPGFNASANDINCYPRVPVQPDAAACGDILHAIEALPHFDRIQEFVEGVRPQIYAGVPTSLPPFLFLSPEEREGKCAVVVQALQRLPDQFSWQQVNHALQAILTECADPGNGGWARLGEHHLWAARISGFNPGPHLVAGIPGLESS